jgi:RNA polymerase sigma-70 factor (ECF subfamily)
MSEKSIIADLQQKIALYEDMNAYKQLYELLNERLFWFIYSFVKSREAAEELVSDVFIKLWKIRDELPSIRNLQVFLYVIARNYSLNYIIKEYKYPHVSLDEIQLDVTTSINPEELYISTEMSGKINKAISELPAQCRLIFRMVREDGLKHREVADILNLSKTTIRNQLVIAVRKIAQAMQPHLEPVASKQRYGQ